jgi:hypothetical protein
MDWPLESHAEQTEARFRGPVGEVFQRGSVSLHRGEQTYDAHLRIRRPDGSVGRALKFTMTSKYEDGTISERGIDETGFLTINVVTDTIKGTGSFGVSRSRIVGEQIDAALPTVEFLNELHEPNILQASWPRAPFGDYIRVPERTPKFPESVIEYLHSLSVIQTRSDQPVLIPDLTTLTTGDVQDINEAADLISGETLRSSWTRFRWTSGRPRATTRTYVGEIDPRDHYQLLIIDPLIVNVGEDQLTLGTIRTLLLSVRLVPGEKDIEAFPLLNDTMERTFDPNTPAPDRSNRPVLGKSLGALDDLLPPNTADRPPHRRSLRAAGAGRSGQHDISERIEELLATEVRQSRQ